VTINERLVFEQGSAGRRGFNLPELDVPSKDVSSLIEPALVRDTVSGMPELSEVDVIRHFTRLSTWNYHIDLGLYPLGSCTMKYNPKINERMARLEGFVLAHPFMPTELIQGVLEVQKTLESCLAEITGMDAVSLQPAAGAQGELTALLMIRAYHDSQGRPRKKVLIPDSAHGTNPASVTISGYSVQNIPSNKRGTVDLDHIRKVVDDDVAAIMITNPNTLGVFESEIAEIAEVMHSHGALVYMDGANLNAMMGITRPGDFGIDVLHINLHKTRSNRFEEDSRTVSALSRFDQEARRELSLRLRSAPVHRKSESLQWSIWNARTRALLHPGKRTGGSERGLRSSRA
jgi:glycine dehydrogenase subunit 2